MRSNRGFAQIELLIAIAVLAIGILGVTATFAYALRAETHAARLTEAVGHARQIMGLVRVRNLPFVWAPQLPPNTSGVNDSPHVRRPLDASPFVGDLAAGSSFTRNVRIERVSSLPSDYRYGIMRVTVAVYWSDRGAEKKLELVAYHRQP